MPKIFSSFLFGLNVISKKKKKGHHADKAIFFSDFMLISKKKVPSSNFCSFSPRFLQHTRARRREPRLSTVFGRKQNRRFLSGEKTPEFAKFECENAGKNFALFALFCAYREHCPGVLCFFWSGLLLPKFECQWHIDTIDLNWNCILKIFVLIIFHFCFFLIFAHFSLFSFFML